MNRCVFFCMVRVWPSTRSANRTEVRKAKTHQLLRSTDHQQTRRATSPGTHSPNVKLLYRRELSTPTSTKRSVRLTLYRFLDPETGHQALPTLFLFLVLLLVLRLFHFKTDRRQTWHRLQIGDNIIHHRTVSDFHVEFQLVKNQTAAHK